MDAGVAPTIQRAEENMKEWRDKISTEVDDSPGSHAQIEVFTKELRQRVDDVEYDLLNGGSSDKDFGRRLWGDSVRLPVDSFPALPFPLTRSLLTGAIADLRPVPHLVHRGAIRRERSCAAPVKPVSPRCLRSPLMEEE